MNPERPRVIMVRREPALLLVLVLFLAGCLAPGEELADEVPVLEGPVLTTEMGAAWTGSPLIWRGAPLEVTGESGCGNEGCAAYPFRFDIPHGHWKTHTGRIIALVTWDDFHLGDGQGRFSVDLRRSEGEVVSTTGGASMAAIAILEAPTAGEYTLEVRAEYGSGAYMASLQVVSAPRDAEARDLLPDLVMMPITELAIEHFSDIPVPHPADVVVGGKGCDPHEFLEHGARRCLRFSTAVGNGGEGPLEVRLDAAGAAQAMALLGGQFMQRVHRSDGTYTDVPVGTANFHHAHLHYHYEGLARFALYAYDLAAEARGELVSEQRKAGFCFYDMGPVALDNPNITAPRFNTEANCLFPTPDEEWVTGISPGWFDLYWSALSDQYVDVAGVPDGVYELVALAGDGIMREADPDNNAASIVFRMTGDHIQVLHSPTHPEE
jgi:hypothetical protein